MENLTIQQEVAQHLLSIKAIQLRPDQPFTWASGWNSPIYCDNRLTLSFPIIRNFIRNEFAKQIITGNRINYCLKKNLKAIYQSD